MAGAYGHFLQSVLYPTLDLGRGRHTMARLRRLREMERWDPECLRMLQFDAARRMLVYAVHNVPFYRDRFRRIGFDPEADFRCLDDLQKLPRLTKEEIRQHFEYLKSEDTSRRYVADGTGGSTGAPTRFLQDQEKMGYLRAAIINSFEWSSVYRFGDRRFHIGGSSFDANLSATVIGKLKNRLWNQMIVSSFGYDTATLDSWTSLVSQFRPTMLSGYPSVMAAFAAHLSTKGIRLPMKVVVTSSEYLYSEQRALIEDAFQCEVFDNYSSREFALAAECEAHEGYHVQDPVVVLECVDEGGKHVPSGTTGDVLVTDLHNWVFPFIRYEIGDQAVPWYDAPRCTCGRTLSRIQAVAGRQGDQLVLPDGRRLPHQFFPHLFKDVTGIREYQLVQESLELIRLRLEKAPNCAQADIDYVTRHIQQYVGPVVKVETEFVDSVRVGSSNKLRRVISYVK